MNCHLTVATPTFRQSIYQAYPSRYKAPYGGCWEPHWSHKRLPNAEKRSPDIHAALRLTVYNAVECHWGHAFLPTGATLTHRNSADLHDFPGNSFQLLRGRDKCIFM